MRDYLSDLVTKNSGTADVLEPRRRARFEPLLPLSPFETAGEPSLPKETFENEESAQPPPFRRPRRRETTRLEETIETTSRADSHENVEHSPPVAARSEAHRSQSPPPETGPTFSPKPIEPARAKTAENPPVAAPIAPTPATPPLAPIAPKIVEKQGESGISNEPPSIVESAAPASKGNDSKAPPRREAKRKIVETRGRVVIEPRVEKIESRVDASTSQQTLIPPPEKQSAKLMPEHVEAVQTSVINVTIGRVEVRAAVSSAPPKRAPVKRPTLSLDEYLRNRGTGGRK